MDEIPDEKYRHNISTEGSYGAAIVSAEGRWLSVNEYLCSMLGYEHGELLEMTFQQITHPKDLAAEQAYLHRLAAGEIDHYRFRKRYLHHEGRIVWGLLERSAVRDAERRPIYFVSRIRDITAEIAAEPQPSRFAHLAATLQRLFGRK